MVVGVATLLYSIDYVPGAFTLAYRVRELMIGRTDEYKLVLLATAELLQTVSEGAREVLEKLYDDIVVIDGKEMQNRDVHARNRVNLALLGRPELANTFHKLQLWKLSQYEKVYYLDSDVFPLNSAFYDAVDHVQDQKAHELVAAPDCGWPDMFNSGVMILVPSLKKYEELLGCVEKWVSIDGADQGLLNQAFNQVCHRNAGCANEWIRLPFVYNVPVSTTGYQYKPAINFFRNAINTVHFLGPKPWTQGPQSSTYHAQWWRVYDRLRSTFFSPRPSPRTEQQPQTASPPQEQAAQTQIPELQAPRIATPPPQASTPAWDPSRSSPPPDSSPEANKLVIRDDYAWKQIAIPSPPITIPPPQRPVSPELALEPTSTPVLATPLPSVSISQDIGERLDISSDSDTSQVENSPPPKEKPGPAPKPFQFPWEAYQPPPTRVFPSK
ncbi:HHL273Cp [Eremothecium sinecaudum]|uniref:HHL273Cp n=1 Tax=Eremothecium sinecaudum TaxID=45286 RepID=A0A0X8HW03_9SACH|nr:HHL273Cp [Eremothecium sinecaudum]AMD22497.1 HHL273Cp [Eremothecium sinecaudum]